MDTRNKRASALGIALACRLVLPNPDGAIAQADRQQVAYSYAGIGAASTATLLQVTADALRGAIAQAEALRGAISQDEALRGAIAEDEDVIPW